MVFKNWDEIERKIEKQSEDTVTLKREQDDIGDLFESHNQPLITISKKMLEQILDLWDENSDLRRENSDLRGYIRMQLDDMFEQSDASREELEHLFAAELADASTDSIDGLLKDYVDPEQDSQELVRSVRDN